MTVPAATSFFSTNAILIVAALVGFLICFWILSSVILQLFPIDTPFGISARADPVPIVDKDGVLDRDALAAAATAAAAAADALINRTKEDILLVIAHPDDECMFFSPTILSVVKKANLHVLCLSNGDAEGLGRVREKELVASCKSLGIDPKRVSSINHEKLQDSMTSKWDANVILDIVVPHVTSNAIHAIITFDDYGITGHPNHIAIYHAIQHGIQSRRLPVPAYALISVNVIRKFSWLIDVAVSFYVYASTLKDSRAYREMTGRFNDALQDGHEQSLQRLFLVSPWEYLSARVAMFEHKSQLVWFRYLYLVFSRYMIVNVLKQIQ